jgi:hypothetical protein
MSRMVTLTDGQAASTYACIHILDDIVPSTFRLSLPDLVSRPKLPLLDLRLTSATWVQASSPQLAGSGRGTRVVILMVFLVGFAGYSRGYTAASTRHSGWAGQIEGSTEASVSWQAEDSGLQL